MSCVRRTKGWSWNAGGWLGMQERSLSANCLEGTTWLPSTRSLYLLSSSFHGAGPFSVELQFPRILFFAAPQTVRSAWQCASAFGTSGWCAETEPQCLAATAAFLRVLLAAQRVRQRLRGLVCPFFFLKRARSHRLSLSPGQLRRCGK